MLFLGFKFEVSITYLSGAPSLKIYTYWSSAMSSRVRVSNREWMSALERTVNGMLTT